VVRILPAHMPGALFNGIRRDEDLRHEPILAWRLPDAGFIQDLQESFLGRANLCWPDSVYAQGLPDRGNDWAQVADLRAGLWAKNLTATGLR
jgi:hypothetical protein